MRNYPRVPRHMLPRYRLRLHYRMRNIPTTYWHNDKVELTGMHKQRKTNNQNSDTLYLLYFIRTRVWPPQPSFAFSDEVVFGLQIKSDNVKETEDGLQNQEEHGTCSEWAYATDTLQKRTNESSKTHSGQYIHKGGLRRSLLGERDDCNNRGYSCESNYAN